MVGTSLPPNSAPEASAPLSPRSICERDARSEPLQDVHVHSRKALATLLDLPLAKPHEEAPATVARQLRPRRESQTSVPHRTKHTSRCTGITTSVTWRHGGRDRLPILRFRNEEARLLVLGTVRLALLQTFRGFRNVRMILAAYQRLVLDVSGDNNTLL